MENRTPGLLDAIRFFAMEHEEQVSGFVYGILTLIVFYGIVCLAREFREHFSSFREFINTGFLHIGDDFLEKCIDLSRKHQNLQLFALKPPLHRGV